MKMIIGIDEVGRGPLAGPVTVCVVSCEVNMYSKLKHNKRLPPLGKDSKKLSPESRQSYAKFLKSLMSKSLFDIPQGESLGGLVGKFSYVVVHISNTIIDTKGISFAIKKAISDGIKKLKLNPKNSKVLLDGGLKAPIKFKDQKTIIKGDEKEKIIAWASILAKVSRDELMCKMAKKFPLYLFDVHKGYGTLKHREAIIQNGLSFFHRKTFCVKLTKYFSTV